MSNCTCPRTHEDPGMVRATFQVSTDAQGMIVLRAVGSDGHLVAELVMSREDAFGVGLALGANAAVADEPVLGVPRPRAQPRRSRRDSRSRLEGRG